ncbi:MAG: (4Fe-4S)-binding protein [Proteobacteria bacterium]|nr:(4Fe-4S)-binding protein [Pseudomonadota bacterium]
MTIEKKTKTVKLININVDKCNGCRACEMICSSVHAVPKYSSNNPARSRIRIVRDPLADIYVPVYAGDYAVAECAGKSSYTIDGKDYSACSFCRDSCSFRDIFKEPDSGLPLKCDMCEAEPEGPLCIKWCDVDALTYEEKEMAVDTDSADEKKGLEVGVDALVDKYGLQELKDTLARLSEAD